MPVPAFLQTERLYIFSGSAGYDGQMQHYLGSQLLGSPMYAQAPDNLRRLGLRGMFAGGGEVARNQFLMANPQLFQQQAVAGLQKKLGYQ